MKGTGIGWWSNRPQMEVVLNEIGCRVWREPITGTASAITWDMAGITGWVRVLSPRFSQNSSSIVYILFLQYHIRAASLPGHDPMIPCWSTPSCVRTPAGSLLYPAFNNLQCPPRVRIVGSREQQMQLNLSPPKSQLHNMTHDDTHAHISLIPECCCFEDKGVYVHL
jgi:hypothetical protein